MKWLIEEWNPFIKGIVAREKLPDWNRLWDDFIKEELPDEDLLKKKKTSDDNMTLVGRMKGKAKKNLSKMKCYNCGEYGHYLTSALLTGLSDLLKEH